MATITIDAGHPRAVIHREIYGHFSEHLGRCIYGGLFVGKDSPIPNDGGIRLDAVEALKRLNLPALRWPGGCFADEYHWRDGVGPLSQRSRMVNTNWGGVVEDNSFGTHEFLHLCELIGCEPYINANVGSGTVREMSEWVEYLNSDGDSSVVRERRANGHDDPFGVRFWGVGNESWGCGGNMRPEYYTDEYRRYQTFCRDYGAHKLYRIACGPSDNDYRWTEVLMERAAKYMDALTLHYYTIPGADFEHKGSALVFDEAAYNETIGKAAHMDELIRGHLAIMDRYDPAHRVGLIVDEWGCWYQVEPGTNPGFLYQQNTMRDAMVAAVTLDIFNRHADRVVMANLAQMVNVLQALLLTDGDKLVLTPTYHAFALYRPHMDANLLDCAVSANCLEGGVPSVTASASIKDGAVTLTCSNLSATTATDVQIRLDGLRDAKPEGQLLSGDAHAYNDFDHPTDVQPRPLQGLCMTDGVLSLTLPPCALASITFRA